MRGRSFRYTRPVKTASDRQVAAGGIASVPAQTSWLGVLGWAAYLACSWTWCIGMFLPVLLVRDYGVWGWVVFAVPNVIGAGAMGWVLRNGAAERIARIHRGATVAFGGVTVVFQLYFLLWMSDAGHVEVPPAAAAPSRPWWLFFVVYAAMAGLGWVLVRFKDGRAWPLALWCGSFVVGAWLTFAGRLDFAGALARSAASGHATGVLWLAPVCVFGFLLCPYLDLTFLHADSQQNRSESRASFTLGFGVLFLAMILFTLGYTTAFIPMSEGVEQRWPMSLTVNLVGLHMLAQIVFTVGVHIAAIVRSIGTRGLKPSLVLLLGAVVLGGLVWAIQFRWIPGLGGLVCGEVVYRCFMSFYGLVFPAYVWLCMIPSRDGHSGIDGAIGRRKLVVLLGACALAAPCYWMGFIERAEWWLAPGLGVVLVARLLVRGRAKAADGVARAS